MLTYNEENHEYFWNGQKVPCVSDILNILFGDFCSYGKDDRTEDGRNIHLACKYLDLDILDFATLDNRYVPYVEAWIKFKEENKGITGIIDIKSGQKKIRDKFQLLMYSKLIKEEFPLIEEGLYSEKFGYAGTPDRFYPGSKDCYGVYLRNDSSYKLEKYTFNKADWNYILCALQILKLRKES